ncbi:MAG: chorismate-binding protein [Candidatus Amulumruptor caecigallinarius]|nr:chorismate-binding protein [Candidatus Amulumruptor caecigallinarius]MCM1397624.1 chorismate-binding protein [Candidatus Amulumruptor caecigallinarius]MCM1454593.1 chorismate-binding protein [bacterium]
MTTTTTDSQRGRGIIATETQLNAAERCDAHHIPFILYALPGETEATFYADVIEGEALRLTKRHAVITEADESMKDDAESVVITEAHSAEEIMEMKNLPSAASRHHHVSAVSPSAVGYMACIHEVAASLGRGSQKAVIARIIAGKTQDSIHEIAARLFTGEAGTMRFMFYTHDTGLWFGSTPELLLSCREDASGTTAIRSIALAGTLPAESTEPWDKKNIKEQSIVEGYMMGKMMMICEKETGLRYSRGERTVGPVKHLCTEFTANLSPVWGDSESERFIHPTPAVAGYPLEKACELISRYENINRRCYSGLLTVETGGTGEHVRIRETYVMLRCATLGERLDNGERTYNIYAGGGILHDSKPATEWDETARKALPMLHVLTGIPVNEIQVTSLFDQIKLEQELQDATLRNVESPF